MSQDGADIGVGAERALGTVLGGEPQPTDEEQQTVEEMLDRILSAPIEAKSYDGAATACARIIIEAWDRYPPLKYVPSEALYLKGGDGMLVYAADGGLVKIGVGLHEVLKRLHADDSPESEVLAGLSGFMWGWAVNAARRCAGLGPVPNPAIMEIGQ